ncbi:hypothetical protein BGZ98_006803 [Dissophora globulifera]|nr:hypothetical protein BGZ98_006803 [Dissophora globulifera]
MDENPSTFENVDAKDLHLWQVSVPVLAAGIHEPVILDSLGYKKELSPAIRLSRVFLEEEELPEEAIHIVVERPQALKRDRDEDDDDPSNRLTIRKSRAKRRRSSENRQSYTAADGESLDLPPFISEMLKDDKYTPASCVAFSSLLHVQAGSTIATPSLGQKPKFFGEGYQSSTFFVTELMMELWEALASDGVSSVKKVLSGPMGVGKSYIAWFLAAKAYVHGWPVLYIADARVLNNSLTEESASTEICRRFLALNQDILTAKELYELIMHE